jgi:hypothetical protein
MADGKAQALTVKASDVVDGRFNPSAYPHRHLAVIQVGKIGPPVIQIPKVMSAVETLSQLGWDLVSFTMEDRTVVAVLRRRSRPDL